MPSVFSSGREERPESSGRGVKPVASAVVRLWEGAEFGFGEPPTEVLGAAGCCGLCGACGLGCCCGAGWGCWYGLGLWFCCWGCCV